MSKKILVLFIYFAGVLNLGSAAPNKEFIGLQNNYCELKGSVYIEQIASFADYKIYVEDVESFADFSVYKEENPAFTTEVGAWHFTDVKAYADFSIYFEDVKSFADFSIYYTRFRGDTGCH